MRQARTVEHEEVAVTALMAMIERFSYVIASRQTVGDDDEMLDTLAAAGAWDQFAIRRSNHRGPAGTIVIDDVSEAGEAILCPAQHTAAEADAKSEACATCGLCWSASAKDKTIAFLRHGMKARPAAEAA